METAGPQRERRGGVWRLPAQHCGWNGAKEEEENPLKPKDPALQEQKQPTEPRIVQRKL
jgi:hypothetical protein